MSSESLQIIGGVGSYLLFNSLRKRIYFESEKNSESLIRDIIPYQDNPEGKTKNEWAKEAFAKRKDQRRLLFITTPTIIAILACSTAIIELQDGNPQQIPLFLSIGLLHLGEAAVNYWKNKKYS